MGRRHAVESIAMDGQSIRSEVAAAVTHNSDSQLGPKSVKITIATPI